MVSPAARERFLNAPWLVDLDPASRQSILQVLAERREPAGAVLLEQGRPNDHMAFLIEGTVAIERPFPDGRIEVVANLMAPSVFGEMSFFRSTASIATVRATSDVRMLTLDHHAHGLLRRADPKAAEQLAVAAVRVLADRLDALDRRVSEYIASKPQGHPKSTEWANFRARLFEESNI